jgi:GTP1/Obg family GTP-binding protein
LGLCQALKETQSTLKWLTDQTESQSATLRANVLPSKKTSPAFVRAVLKYNTSPQTIDEMISDLREMQTEIQDRLGNLETSFKDVQELYDFFHQQLVRVPTSVSLLSTSTTLTARVQLVSWLGKFGGRDNSKRSRIESRAVSSLNLFRDRILILVPSEL